jgi:hypothetical protein
MFVPPKLAEWVAKNMADKLRLPVSGDTSALKFLNYILFRDIIEPTPKRISDLPPDYPTSVPILCGRTRLGLWVAAVVGRGCTILKCCSAACASCRLVLLAPETKRENQLSPVHFERNNVLVKSRPFRMKTASVLPKSSLFRIKNVLVKSSPFQIKNVLVKSSPFQMKMCW